MACTPFSLTRTLVNSACLSNSTGLRYPIVECRRSGNAAGHVSTFRRFWGACLVGAPGLETWDLLIKSSKSRASPRFLNLRPAMTMLEKCFVYSTLSHSFAVRRNPDIRNIPDCKTFLIATYRDGMISHHRGNTNVRLLHRRTHHHRPRQVRGVSGQGRADDCQLWRPLYHQ